MSRREVPRCKKGIRERALAYRLGGSDDCYCLATLAAAYAECGDFEQAKHWQAKAIELAITDDSVTDKAAQEFYGRLELYEQGKPYRQELKKQP